jgi:paraquat-inducible protein B
MYPGADLHLVADASMPYPELPTIPGAFEAISQSIAGFVSKLETLDIEELGNNINGILRGANELVNKDIDEKAVTDLQASMRALKGILQNVEEGNLETTIEAARGVLLNLQNTLKMVDSVLEPEAPLQYNVIKVTDELEETSRAIRSLIETLERDPNALIFGRKQQEDEQ